MIDEFRGEYAWLSNFWMRSFAGPAFDLPLEKEFVYRSGEHCFQAQKAQDEGHFYAVVTSSKPGDAKRMGRKISLRPDWEDVKDDVMYFTLDLKFRDPELRAKLLATGDAKLIEGNYWGDTVWGVCRGVGQNLLGQLLMDLREDIRIGQNA